MLSPVFKKIGILIAVAVVVIVIVIASFISRITKPVSATSEQVDFLIAKGSGVDQIADSLLEENLISKRWAFKLYLVLTNNDNQIKAGQFQLDRSLNIVELTDILVGGRVDEDLAITIIEGWNNREIGEYLEKKEVVSQSEFLTAVKNFNQEADYDFFADKPAGLDVEGFLFPDTYRIFKEATADDIIRKMLDNFDQKLTADLKTEINKQNKTIFEVITLASIIEKELSTDDDRAIAADLFYRRLEIGMPLQSDATVNYVTRKKDLQPLIEDTKINDPYNTYQNRGLPPGPISNPSLSAIKAVIFPRPNDYFYFLTTKDGQVIYSRTHEEHVANKQKYLN